MVPPFPLSVTLSPRLGLLTVSDCTVGTVACDIEDNWEGVIWIAGTGGSVKVDRKFGNLLATEIIGLAWGQARDLERCSAGDRGGGRLREPPAGTRAVPSIWYT